MLPKWTKRGKIFILIIYVDDIILTYDGSWRNSIFEKVGTRLQNQRFSLDFRSDIGLLDCKAVKTTLDAILKLDLAKVEEMIDKEKFHRLDVKLVYLSHMYPNITFAISKINQYMH